MYNFNNLGHRVTLPCLDLRSNFDLDLSRSNYTCFDAPWRDKHDRNTIVILSFKTKTLSSKTILVKFDLLTSGDLNFDLSLKMTEVVSEWFLPSFRSRFPICSTMRRSRDRRGGGGVQTPPPSGGGNSRGPPGRGLTRAPLGGGADSAPLSNIRDNSRTTQDIATKLSVPYWTSIWHLV